MFRPSKCEQHLESIARSLSSIDEHLKLIAAGSVDPDRLRALTERLKKSGSALQSEIESTQKGG